MNAGDELLPPLRSELELELRQHREQEVILLRDPSGIAAQDIMLDASLFPVLEALDGTHTIYSLYNALRSDASGEFPLSELAAFIRALDEACLLESEYFFDQKIFLESDVRHPVCAGICYPADPKELHEFLDGILAKSPVRSYPTNARVVVAPHIDFRVDEEIYAAPFNALRDSEFDVVIHIGTSHYGWQDRFMLSSKDFLSPLGRLRADKDIIEDIHRRMNGRLSRNDSAHQPEHSLELHHVFLQHLFADRNFSIVPILVGSFQDAVDAQRDPSRDEATAAFCRSLMEAVEASHKKALWLVSGDLAHIGKRFGDEWEAAGLLDTLRSEDFEIMNAMVNGRSAEYFQLISRDGDRRRICGLPPVWTMLNTLKPGKGTALGYNQWDDHPTGTAVSYGAAAWW